MPEPAKPLRPAAALRLSILRCRRCLGSMWSPIRISGFSSPSPGAAIPGAETVRGTALPRGPTIRSPIRRESSSICAMRRPANSGRVLSLPADLHRKSRAGVPGTPPTRGPRNTRSAMARVIPLSSKRATDYDKNRSCSCLPLIRSRSSG